jgi:hypothetical protein
MQKSVQPPPEEFVRKARRPLFGPARASAFAVQLVEIGRLHFEAAARASQAGVNQVPLDLGQWFVQWGWVF